MATATEAGLPIPALQGFAALRWARRVRHDPLAAAQELRDRFGPIGMVRLGPLRLVVISSWSLARHILERETAEAQKGVGLAQAAYFLGDGQLTSSGEAWSAARDSTLPFFRHAPTSQIIGRLNEELTSLVNQIGLGPAAPDMERMVGRTLLRVLAPTLASPRRECDVNHILDDFAVLKHWVSAQFCMPFEPLPRIRWFFAHHARTSARRLRRLVDDASARHCPFHQGGALPTLDQSVTLLFTGVETASLASVWTLYYLAATPAAADAVASEAMALDSDRAPWPPCRRLTLTEAAVREALRLQPPVWALTRRHPPGRLGRYSLPSRTHILINVKAIHTDEAVWDDPLRFIPTRFLGEGGVKPAYLPFGLGVRRCIGSRLAISMVTLIVARLLQAFRPQTLPLSFGSRCSGLTLRGPGPRLILTKRRAPEPAGARPTVDGPVSMSASIRPD